jgi:hypothetical protein
MKLNKPEANMQSSHSAMMTLLMTITGSTIHASRGAPSSTAEQTMNAAYRDGLFHGGLAAKRGNPHHVAIGRWATEHDRESYRSGYDRAYTSTVALLAR